MVNYAITLAHYNEIKDRVPHGEPEHYLDPVFKIPCVEVDVNEDIFIEVSTKLGWM